MSFSPNLYKHELDQKAFDALSIFPKFVKLRESYIANVDEKAAKINFLSSAKYIICFPLYVRSWGLLYPNCTI